MMSYVRATLWHACMGTSRRGSGRAGRRAGGWVGAQAGRQMGDQTLCGTKPRQAIKVLLSCYYSIVLHLGWGHIVRSGGSVWPASTSANPSLSWSSMTNLA